jgi:replication-associated recombination protein RarA
MSLPRDPWVDVKTVHGFAADLVISALQKEIRRGNTENAALIAYEMVATSPALEDYFWQRIMVISVEDIGFGNPMAPVVINAVVQMVDKFDRSVAERKLFAVHAVRYLCGGEKDRSSDEMINWIMHSVESGKVTLEIPDYAVDMHTKSGKEKGRSLEHFWNEGARIMPEKADRDRTYYERMKELVESGQIK